MSRIVGYADINFAANSAHLKRAALVTDEIRLTAMPLILPSTGPNIEAGLNVQELMWLHEKGVVSMIQVAQAWKYQLTQISNWLATSGRDVFLSRPPPPLAYSSSETERDSARWAARLADLHEPGISATVITSEALFRRRIEPKAASTALEVVLHQMPVPDDQTAWDDILTWRSDEAAREKYRRLKHWVHNVVGGTEQPKHLEDHLLTLLDDYRDHMRLHRMKVRTAQTKAIVVPILETVRNVFTGRWGEWAKAAFTVKEQQHALLEAELKAPGREVAYIVDAQERFGTNGS